MDDVLHNILHGQTYRPTAPAVMRMSVNCLRHALRVDAARTACRRLLDRLLRA
jgi:hypothetical protein